MMHACRAIIITQQTIIWANFGLTEACSHFQSIAIIAVGLVHVKHVVPFQF